MSDEELTPGQVKEITDYVDIEAPPPEACTWLSTNELAHNSSPPATSRTAARTSPTADVSTSNVLLST